AKRSKRKADELGSPTRGLGAEALQKNEGRVQSTEVRGVPQHAPPNRSLSAYRRARRTTSYPGRYGLTRESRTATGRQPPANPSFAPLYRPRRSSAGAGMARPLGP